MNNDDPKAIRVFDCYTVASEIDVHDEINKYIDFIETTLNKVLDELNKKDNRINEQDKKISELEKKIDILSTHRHYYDPRGR